MKRTCSVINAVHIFINLNNYCDTLYKQCVFMLTTAL